MNYYQPSTGKTFTGALLAYMALPKDEAALRELGYLPITYVYPAYDKWRQRLEPDGAPVANADGTGYTQTFTVVPLPPDCLAASLARYKEEALEKLKAAHLAAEQNGKLESSAGFTIDANERANRDIAGLITSLEEQGQTEASFCAADNSMHTVTLESLKAMRLEVIAYGQALYARKWALREAIENAASFDEVDAVNISFAV